MAESSHLIFCLLPATPTPPNHAGAPPHLPLRTPTYPTLPSKTHRRSASILLISLAALAPISPFFHCSSAAAFNLGISGPKEWLKDQKKKASKFLMAPIVASRGSLQTAYLVLTSDSESQAEDLVDIRKLLNSAARDCVAEERSSIVAFQARTGVEVCTFRLLVKNAASLLDDTDPVKLETEAMLDELIRSFTSLGNLVDNSDLQLASDRKNVVAGLMDTMLALDSFEQGIKNCVGI